MMRRIMHITAAAASLAAALLPAPALAAVTLPPPLYGQSTSALVGQRTHSRSTSVAGTNTSLAASKLDTANGTSIIARIPGPSVSASAITTSAAGVAPHKLAATALNLLQYKFQVVGPAATVPVIITQEADLAGANPVSQGSCTYLNVASNLGHILHAQAACPSPPATGFIKYACPVPVGTKISSQCGAASNTATMKVTAAPALQPVPNSVTIGSGAWVNSGVGSSSAQLAVKLAIDPSFAKAGLYHIVVSSGLGNP